MDEFLQSDVLNRLELDKTIQGPVADLVLAALTGQIEECLGGFVRNAEERTSCAFGRFPHALKLGS